MTMEQMIILNLSMMLNNKYYKGNLAEIFKGDIKPADDGRVVLNWEKNGQ